MFDIALNVLDHARETQKKDIYVDFRLFTKDGEICFSMMDLSDQFDPAEFYELNRADYPQKHIGISIAMNMAKEVRYYSAFNSNNLIVFLDMNRQKNQTA